ncbi:MAG: dihydrofolate reductase family protein [Acidobacteriaceae bacterium]
MAKVIMFNLISLDGYFEGAQKWDLAWHRVDEEFNQFAIAQLDRADGLLFGRVTYEGMAAYWSSAEAISSDPEVASRMNSIRKYVFTRTLDRVAWNNTQLVKGDAVELLTRLKRQPGRDLLLFGSADLAATFTRHGLIDEYRIMVIPVILGAGGPLFNKIEGLLKLQLLETKTFRNGNVLLNYAPGERN